MHSPQAASRQLCGRSEEHTSELQSLAYLVCRLLLEKKKNREKHRLATTFFIFFFFNDTATTEIYTLSLHDALPISPLCTACRCETPRRQHQLRCKALTRVTSFSGRGSPA